MTKEYEEQLQQANSQVAKAYQKAREDAQKHREALEVEATKFAESELEKNRATLKNEVSSAREKLTTQSPQLAQLVTNQLLN